MVEHRRRTPRNGARAAAIVVLLGVLAAGCSWSRLDESSSGEMRPVPTVPATLGSGEDVAVAPESPTGPVTTELVGDPRPDPDSDVALPPLPEALPFDACVRLGEYQVAEQFGAAAGVGVASAEPIDDGACRFTAGAGVAEIHYVSEDVIESDWFRRDAIEPVGDVSADAVGIAEFLAPGSDSGAGYTIALVSRREGAVIAVRGTSEDRLVAVQLANVVESST
ncbi:MAG TPA: hypothetical protein VMY16_15255 [Ilumatobacteraceae bacterium]|nr:hypothetical protein [Ilumatobacteraceae bacterium]HUV20109.1 hypothetical protein [Ilumatobacteraceae bacterium]